MDMLKLCPKPNTMSLHQYFSDTERGFIRGDNVFLQMMGIFSSLGTGQSTKELPGSLTLTAFLLQSFSVHLVLKLPSLEWPTTMVCLQIICRWDGSQSWCCLVAGGSSCVVLIQLCRSLHVKLSPCKTSWWSRHSSRSAVSNLYLLPGFPGCFLSPQYSHKRCFITTFICLPNNQHFCKISWAVDHVLTVSSMGWCEEMGYGTGSLCEETAGGDYISLRITYRHYCPVGPWDLC